MLNNYTIELKGINPGSNVLVVSKRKNSTELPVFQRMYVCLTVIRENFLAGCRRLISLDGCFLKGLLKGHILVVVTRDGNN